MSNNKRLAVVVLIAICFCLPCACHRESPNPYPQFTPDDIAEILKLSPLPPLPPPSPTNRFADSEAAAQFGQRLFFNQQLSSNGQISCATCHDPGKGFSDAKSVSSALDTLDRNSQALWNVAYQRWFFWDGRADSLWAQSIQPMLDPREMGAAPEQLRSVIANDSVLEKEYRTLFGELPDPEASHDRFLSNLGKAIEAYQRKIVSRDSDFDRFVVRIGKPGTTTHLSASALRGLKLFVGRGKCILCHSGPNFSDGEFHNIGLPKNPDLQRDSGRFLAIRKVLEDRFNGLGKYSDDQTAQTNVKLQYLVVKMNNLGEFKTPTLRNVAQTAPYMHDGRFATLREVLDFYSELPGEPPVGHREETLVPLKLSETEKRDIEAFLRSLTGAQLDVRLLNAEGIE